ncbi:MAG: hypothetical protein LBM23_01395 [Propionibacteriaceae bacterium]|jgi:hypothetical protein|nr:hypothetical protein [Propionibacteriaceae bacterium]
MIPRSRSLFSRAVVPTLVLALLSLTGTSTLAWAEPTDPVIPVESVEPVTIAPAETAPVEDTSVGEAVLSPSDDVTPALEEQPAPTQETATPEPIAEPEPVLDPEPVETLAMPELAAVEGLTSGNPVVEAAGLEPRGATTGILASELDDVDLRYMPGPLRRSTEVAAATVVEPGTAVPHQFDVALVTYVDDPSEIPPAGTMPAWLDRAPVVEWLKGAETWWSANTGLDFDFMTGLNIQPVYSLRSEAPTPAAGCVSTFNDPMAAFGMTREEGFRHYTSGASNLLVVDEPGTECSYHLTGLAYSLPTQASVFAGGVFELYPYAAVSAEPQQIRTMSEILAHEFGHTIGLGHSNISDCLTADTLGDDTLGPVWDLTLGSGLCSTVSYGDGWTIMGMTRDYATYGTPEPTLDAIRRWQLGLVADGAGIEEVTVADGETFTLRLSDVSTAGAPQAVIVPDVTTDPTRPASSSTYAIEFRRGGSGYFMQTSQGLYVTALADEDPARIYTPTMAEVVFPRETTLVQPLGATTTERMSGPIPMIAGDRFVSPDGRVVFEVVSVGAETAEVRVDVADTHGVAGQVWIEETLGGDLIATEALGSDEATVSFQWFLNGEAIAGATDRVFTPTAVGPTDVYRVEATMTQPGRVATVRTSLGFAPGAQQLTVLAGSAPAGGAPADGVSGPIVEYQVLSSDGLPDRSLPGAIMTMVTLVSSDTPAVVSEQAVVMMLAPDRPGVYQGRIVSVVPGQFTATVQPMVRYPLYKNLIGEEPAAPLGTVELTFAPVSTTSVAVTYSDAQQVMWTSPITTAIGPEGLTGGSAQVVVTALDDSGAPLAGKAIDVVTALPFGFSKAGTPGETQGSFSTVTDEFGRAVVDVSWLGPRGQAGACGLAPLVVLVDGSVVAQPTISLCNGYSRAEAGVVPASTPMLEATAWVEQIEGQDTYEVRFRVFDESGQPVTDRAEDYAIVGLELGGTVSPIVFDEASGWYRATVTMTVAGDYNVLVVETATSAQVWAGVIGVEVGQGKEPLATQLSTDTSGAMFASAGGACVDPLASTTAVVVDALGGGGAPLPGVPVVFSADPPLSFEAGPLVSTNQYGQAILPVTSTQPGTFTISANLADTPGGGPVVSLGSVEVTFTNAPADSAASTVAVSDGTRQADGTDSHTVTIAPVSLCGAPIIGAAAEIDLVVTRAADARVLPVGDADALASTARGVSDAEGVTVSAITETFPGVYSATITSTVPGEYRVEAFYEASPLGDPQTVVFAAPQPAPDPAAPTDDPTAPAVDPGDGGTAPADVSETPAEDPSLPTLPEADFWNEPLPHTGLGRDATVLLAIGLLLALAGGVALRQTVL